MRIKEIAKLSSGLILSRKRARNELELKKHYKVLSLNNIEIHGDFNEAELESFPSNEILPKRYFTQVGDILVRLNEPYTTVCIQKHQANILVPSYFVSIKLTDQSYLPEYVSWYLNSNVVKRIFYQAQSGTVTPNINQRVIQDLTIPKLPLAKQEKVMKIHQLYLKERRLLKSLIEEKDRYYESISNKFIYEKMEEY